MQWGSTQEATSLLTALNYFGRQGARLSEAGLYPLEAIYPTHEDLVKAYPVVGQFESFPPIGASPGKKTCTYPSPCSILILEERHRNQHWRLNK